jgi:transcriptional regulator with XRE-family HTH domain
MVLHRTTQQTAADELGLTQRAISRRLTGEVDFSANELEKLAKLLAVPVGTFFGEVSA